jgi:RecA-family ATPase
MNKTKGWPDKIPGYIVEAPVKDLLDQPIDYGVNVLGNRFLERGTYGTIIGSSGIGKSVLAVQIGILAAVGREVFGLKVDRPLRVLVVQAEDSWNDRVEQATGIVNSLDLSKEEKELLDENLKIVTPEHRADRGEALFNSLRQNFREVPLDLLILNPAFAFIEGNINNVEAVGDFLRNHLQEFTRDKRCAALIMHHVPKPPKSGKGRAADTTMYSGHGSAEFANAPRASMTVERTRANYVFEFTIGKRGAKSGWKADYSGSYRHYFTHSRTGKLFWTRATEADMAAANSGMCDEEFAEVFKGDTDLDLATIQKRMKHYGYAIEEEEGLLEILENLVERGRLTTKTQEGGVNDGEKTWRVVRVGAAKESFENQKGDALFYIEESMPGGIITSELREAVPYGHSVLTKVLKALVDEGKVRRKAEGPNALRYFIT